jgi:hypothetical protein
MEPLTTWRKSSRSGSQGNCVEVATGQALVGIRDSKDIIRAIVTCSPGEWDNFIKAVKAGQFDQA